ncbi:probable E3 ubiquitin-protein ligase RHY1A isoform X1 [Ananas comosus]|uniref:Probable E3 ubiquitin-protein ligase RHY1A isoform X1 n=1 Tax=Ananas comosus TaxID=4615 RepID=A0A6P5GRN1_ANACO|nr:probable E3 ubiquitin-protein ligase RHY1A isoform X1 [Ananas comosus]
MAGMLPGVEFARKRRLRGQGGSAELPSAGSRRSPFCQYMAGYDQAHLTTNSMQRNSLSKELHDWRLGSTAREAKERLDEKLRSQRASIIERHHSTGSLRSNKTSSRGCSGSSDDGGGVAPSGVGSLQREVYSVRKSARRFNWSKLGWEAAEKAECAVCLEDFRRGDILVHLPCAHRFHCSCVVPWLETTPHCPICRTSIFA